MPVFENFPYTNFHELNLDWILKKIKSLETEAIDPGVKGARIKNHRRYYIDGVNGKDTNPGTSGEPFKTIDRFLELSDKYSELRCYIVKAGTYKITKGDNFSDINIHITALDANVILDLCPTSTDPEVSGYMCKWNLQGKSNAEKMVITGHDVHGNLLQDFYFDNSGINFTNCDIQIHFKLFGGAVAFSGCTVKQITIHDGMFTFNNGTVIANTDPDIVPLAFLNSVGRLYGAWSGEELTAAGTAACIYTWNTFLFIGSVVVPNLTNKYLYGIQAVLGGMITCTESRIDAMASRAGSGNDIAYDSVPVVTDHGTRAAESTRYNSGQLQYWDGSAWTNV